MKIKIRIKIKLTLHSINILWFIYLYKKRALQRREALNSVAIFSTVHHPMSWRNALAEKTQSVTVTLHA